jgi:predicted phage gp36 major capsid-like protein
MPGSLPHNPLDDAARKVDEVARRTKSPQFERVAIFTMIASAITTVALAGFQAFHMFRREIRDEQREREREERERARRADPPPERPRHGEAAPEPEHERDDGQRRWSRREEQAAPAAHGRQR